MTQIILWLAAFVVPSFSLGAPVPHAPYVLIPALAVMVGFVDRHAFRRVLIWLGLIFLYELVYHVPMGMFTVPVAAMVLLHIGSSKMIRIEPAAARTRRSFVAVLRTLLGAFVWVSGLVVLTSLWGSVVAGMGAISFNSLAIVWWYHGVFTSTMLALAFVLLLLYIDRRRRVQVVFSDHAVIQTQNISG